MNGELLEFPRGVRLANRAELMGVAKSTGAEDLDVDAEVARLSAAVITTGYVHKVAERPDASDLFEVNVHASHIWTLFVDLTETLLPNVAAPFVGFKNEKPVFGRYTSRSAALDVLAPYRESLQHDGLIEFGIMFQHLKKTEEIFVRYVKYLRIWTNRPERVGPVLARHSLREEPDLQFIDNFPRVSESIPFESQTVGSPHVIDGLKAHFERLPAPPELQSR